MITIEQLKDIKERTEALNRYLDIEGKNTSGRGAIAHAGSGFLG